MPATGEARASSETKREAGQGGFPTAGQLLGLLAAYFTLQVVLRTLISGSADLDESEQLVLTQKLSWGYGSQPPLYTWAQFVVFKVFGVSILSLALLKNLFLFGTYGFTYLNARFITRSHPAGVAAAAALLFIPQIAWESQRDLTHSVLASMFAGATLFCFLRLRERPRVQSYVLFGLCAGLGLLSKYNYALLLAGLLLAAIGIRELRPAVLDKRMLLAAGIMLLLVLPNALWIWHHRELAFQSATKFHIETSRGWLPSVAAGLGSLLKSTATFLCPLVLMLGLVFWKRTGPARPPASEYTRLLSRTLLIIYAALVLSVLVVRVTDIRDRWLQPMLVCAPVLALALLQHRLDRTRLNRLLIAAAVVMVGISAAIPGRILLAERFGRTEPLNRPYAALARQLQGPIGSAPVVVTDTKLLAGNLRLNLPGKIFLTPDLAGALAEARDAGVLAWDALPRKTIVGPTADFVPSGPPASLREFVRRRGATELDLAGVHFVSATFQYHRDRQMWVGILMLPEN